MNTPTANPAPAPAAIPPAMPPGIPAVAKCTLKVTTNEVLLVAPKGKQKSKSYKLGPASGSAKAGKVLTLTVKLPAPAVTALGLQALHYNSSWLKTPIRGVYKVGLARK